MDSRTSSAERARVDVDDFAPRLSFFWDIHNDFEEIAKPARRGASGAP
jgi:methylmalonyl-CoA mutase N-terminal domain/subunit